MRISNIPGWNRWRAKSFGWARAQATSDRDTASRGPALERRVMRDVEVFKYLSDEQMNRVASLGQQVQVPEGKVLGEQGEPGYFLFVIIEGKAELSVRSALGEVTVRIAGPTESFPLSCLVGSGTVITSARAMTPMKVLAIPSGQLLELCSRAPDIGMGMYAAIAEAIANRYKKSLRHLTAGAEMVLKNADMWANL